MERMKPLLNDQMITAEDVRRRADCPRCFAQKLELCVNPDGTLNGRKGFKANHRERVRAALADKSTR